MIPDFALSCSEFESVGLTLSREQYEKSLHDLTEKMGAIINADSGSS